MTEEKKKCYWCGSTRLEHMSNVFTGQESDWCLDCDTMEETK